jgi:hypothetical protein
VSSDTLRVLFQQAVGIPPRIDLDGASANPTVSTSGFFPGSSVSQSADDLCISAPAVVVGVPESGSLTFENQTWGTPNAPVLRCFDGLSTGGDSVTLTGNTSGTGILLIKNSDLVLRGNFYWEGWIVITGANVTLRSSGSGAREIIGGVLINETSSPPSGKNIIDIQDNFRLRFSRRALGRAAGLIPNSLLAQTFPVAPFVITQNYWRTVNP